MTDGNDAGPDERDDVATLIRVAGGRPAVPVERAARVEAAVREHWTREVRRRSRTRSIRTGGVLALAACLVLAVATLASRRGREAPPALPPVLELQSAIGPVSIEGPGGAVRAGARIVTGAGGRAALRHVSGPSVRVDALTRVRVVDSRTLALERGAVYVDSGSDRGGAALLSIRTPIGEVRELGTRFEVRLDGGGLRVRVREGSVALRRERDERSMSAGTEVEVRPDGSVTSRGIATYGPGWEWIAATAPVPAIDGLAAQAFLDWAAREGGWTLKFGDEEAARAAPRTVLRGSVKGLTIEQALDAVLPTCGMTHRIEEGTLWVQTLPR